MLELVDESVVAAEPAVQIHSAAAGKSGETLTFAAQAIGPVLSCHWDFGDGTGQDGMVVRHVFTHPGEYGVRATALGLERRMTSKDVKVTITGEIPTTFDPAAKLRDDGRLSGTFH
jgi:hypothetical protein